MIAIVIFRQALILLLLFFSLAAVADAASYQYDDLGRLVTVTYDNGDSIAYTYDPAGNLLSATVTTGEKETDSPPNPTDNGDDGDDGSDSGGAGNGGGTGSDGTGSGGNGGATGYGGGSGSPAARTFLIDPKVDTKLTLAGVKLTIPAGSTPANVHLTVNTVADRTILPKGGDLQLVGDIYQVASDSRNALAKPASITLAFDKSTIDFGKNSVAVYAWNNETHEWEKLNDSKVDRSAGTVTASFTAFTAFAVFESPLEEPPATAASRITDIHGHWAEQSIQALIQMGAITGYADHSFKPDAPITRAEFIAILVRALHLGDAPGVTFTDTTGQWSESIIGAAAQAGIATGFADGSFHPDDLITREQMAVFAVRALKLMPTSHPVSFQDAEDISDWAREALAIAYDQGLLSGYPDHTVRPKSNATRAEAATIILRALTEIGHK